MKQAIYYLTFECNSLCNMNCPFCFSNWREGMYEIDTRTAKACIARLKEQGLKVINFTGGEPLLRKDLRDLLAFSKAMGLATIVSTNGILASSYLERLAPFIDSIGLPIDSCDAAVHNSIRITRATNNHHDLVLHLIDEIRQKYPHINIKINTLVSKENKETVLGIGDLIQGKVISWKLSHFVAMGYGKEHEERFDISLKDYQKVVSSVESKFPDLKSIASPSHSRDSSCRVLGSNGHLFKPTKNGLEDLGYFLDIYSQEDLFQDLNKKMNRYFFEKTYR